MPYNQYDMNDRSENMGMHREAMSKLHGAHESMLNDYTTKTILPNNTYGASPGDLARGFETYDGSAVGGTHPDAKQRASGIRKAVTRHMTSDEGPSEHPLTSYARMLGDKAGLSQHPAHRQAIADFMTSKALAKSHDNNAATENADYVNMQHNDGSFIDPKFQPKSSDDRSYIHSQLGMQNSDGTSWYYPHAGTTVKPEKYVPTAIFNTQGHISDDITKGNLNVHRVTPPRLDAMTTQIHKNTAASMGLYTPIYNERSTRSNENFMPQNPTESVSNLNYPVQQAMNQTKISYPDPDMRSHQESQLRDHILQSNFVNPAISNMDPHLLNIGVSHWFNEHSGINRRNGVSLVNTKVRDLPGAKKPGYFEDQPQNLNDPSTQVAGDQMYSVSDPPGWRLRFSSVF